MSDKFKNMSRKFSPFINNFFEEKAELDARSYNTHLAIEIQLKNSAMLRFATADLFLTSYSKNFESVDFPSPKFFEGKIENVPEIFFAQDSTSDGSGVFNLINLDYLLSGLIPETSRLLTKAEVTVFRCFQKPDGNYEGVIEGKGFLRLSEGNDETAQISYVSDLSDRSVTTAGEELTQRCQNVFRLMDSSKNSYCGASTDTNIADGSTCSLIFDDEENGCAFYGQQATFHGVPFFNPNAVSGYSGDLDGGTGLDDPPIGNCPDYDSWFLFSDNIWRQGIKVVEGAALKNHLGEIGIVTFAEKVWCDYRYLLRTSGGTELICSTTHHILTALDDKFGTPAMQLVTGTKADVNRRIVDYAEKATVSRFEMRTATPGFVLKISMTDPKTYVAGRQKGRGICSHNRKFQDYL